MASALTDLRQHTALSLHVARFNKARVLLVGDLVADHFIYGQTDRVSREAPVLIVRYESAEVKLGGGANAAANARSLGGQVSALGVMGDDDMGRQLKRALKEAGIRFVGVSASHLETETKTRILAGGISTTRQQMLRLDRGRQSPLPASVRMALAQSLRKAAQSCDAVMVSDYGAGVVGPEIRQSLKKLQKEGLTICADSRYQLQQLEGLSVCKPNEPELEALTGISPRSEKTLKEAGRAALKRLRCQSLVVTRGRNGMAIFDGAGQMELIPTWGNAEAVDVTGAGDTVLAALTLGLAVGASVREAAQIANVAGAQVVQKMGTATVSNAELRQELRGQ